MRAEGYLAQAASLLIERGREYDSEQGERSMEKVVVAFNAITGHRLTEAEGWLFMQFVKHARQSQALGHHEDSSKDAIAYAALEAEARSKAAPKKSTDPVSVGNSVNIVNGFVAPVRANKEYGV